MDVKSGPDIIGRLRFLLCLGANLVIYYDVICLDSILSKPTSTPGIRVFSIQYAQLNFIYCNMFYYLLGRIFQLQQNEKHHRQFSGLQGCWDCPNIWLLFLSILKSILSKNCELIIGYKLLQVKYSRSPLITVPVTANQFLHAHVKILLFKIIKVQTCTSVVCFNLI